MLLNCHLCGPTINAVATLLRKTRGTEPSRLFMHYNERHLIDDIMDDGGIALSEVLRAVHVHGICSEQDWPHVKENEGKKPANSCYDSPGWTKSIRYYRIPPVLNNLEKSLIAGEIFAFGFVVFASFETPWEDVLPLPQDGERVLGGSAAVCVGFDTEKRLLCVRGVRSDEQEVFYVPYAFVVGSFSPSRFDCSNTFLDRWHEEEAPFCRDFWTVV